MINWIIKLIGAFSAEKTSQKIANWNLFGMQMIPHSNLVNLFIQQWPKDDGNFTPIYHSSHAINIDN